MYYKDYDTEGFFDEYFQADGSPRQGATVLLKRLEDLPGGELFRRQKATEARLFQMGVTFTVYGEEEGTERIFPFDIIPRVIEAREWNVLEKGLKQRIYALNLFIGDIYNDKKILKDGVVPEELLRTSKCYRPQCEGFKPPRGIWCHISGTDLVRGGDGVYYVLEDNLRCPSGVSYVLENREVLKRTFPKLFEDLRIRPVDGYPYRLREMLQYMAPDGMQSPTVVLLTPGIYNSAYFEHSFLAQQMGIELVEGGDLVVTDGYVYMKTTKGLSKVDVIYRRIDDDFIDPLAFRKDSLLGVQGIMDVYKSGRVALVNAIGTGIADDKIIYAYVPGIIKYYTGEDPILPNVPTYVCWEELDRKYVLENLESLVVKPANE
ncbi:MAG: circularly permuted type 2 ATP-grasp protein, partial [Thermodesulfobacteriota bacterium]